MSKLGDLFVRLGLKKDDFSKGIDSAEKELQGFAGTAQKMSGIAVAAWAAVVAAVVKFAKDAISYTQKWGDEWKVTMAGIKGAYQSFVRQLSSGEGFDNLFSNMREAARLARETASALDELFERGVSYSYQEAEGKKYIEQQRMIMNDASKSEAERMKAAENIIAKEEELGRVRWDIAKQKRDALSEEFQAQTGLNRAQQSYLIEQYNQNRRVIQQAREYRQERQKVYDDALAASKQVGAGTGVTYDYAAAEAAAAAFDARYSETIKGVAKLTEQYDKSNDELVEGLAKADVALIQVDTDTLRAQQRASRLLGSLSKTTGTGGGGTNEADVVAKQAEQVYLRTQQAAKNEIRLLQEKYAAEKALLQQYGLDTTALTSEYHRNILDAVGKLQQDLLNIPPVTVDVFDIDTSDIRGIADGVEEELAIFAEAQELAQEVNESIAQGFSDACQEMMDQLMGVQDFNMGAVIKALLDPLADLAIKEGEILIASGVGIEAIKKSLGTLEGVGAIIAGGALIAVASAAKAGLAALAKGGATTATTSAAGYGGGSVAGAQNIETEMTIIVEGRVSGSDIVLAGQKTLSNWNR